jgi:hypothetical protein
VSLAYVQKGNIYQIEKRCFFSIFFRFFWKRDLPAYALFFNFSCFFDLPKTLREN